MTLGNTTYTAICTHQNHSEHASPLFRFHLVPGETMKETLARFGWHFRATELTANDILNRTPEETDIYAVCPVCWAADLLDGPPWWETAHQNATSGGSMWRDDGVGP